MLHGNGVSPARSTSDKAEDDMNANFCRDPTSVNGKKQCLSSVPRRMRTPRDAHSIRTVRPDVPALPRYRVLLCGNAGYHAAIFFRYPRDILMPRFFVDMPLSAEQSVSLPETVVRHLHVLRLNPGDPLTLFNGDGPAFQATLSDIGKKQAHAQIAHALPDDQTEPPYRIELIQGIASNEKMDWLIEKAVELGVSHIVPIAAARSVVRLSGERAERRHQHWNALCRAACEQSGRNRVPSVAAPQSFDSWLEHNATQKTERQVQEVHAASERDTLENSRGGPLKLLLSPRATIRFSALPDSPPPDGVQLLIGPEGGWSETEESLARQAGWTALSLGARILRTETAGMALLAALAGRWGGW